MTSQDRNQYVKDRDGNRVYAGDYVRCQNPVYLLKKNDNRRVQRIDAVANLVLININPTRSFGNEFEMRLDWVHARDFSRSACYNPAHKRQKETKEMAKPNTLYIAVRKLSDYQSTVNRIERSGDSPLVPQEDIMASTSFEALKQDVNIRIRQFPDEQWIITGATVLAEISAPPVTYRQL